MVVIVLLLAAAVPAMPRPRRTRASALPPRPPGRAALALLAPRRARFAMLLHPRPRPPIPAQSPAVAPATTAATSAGFKTHTCCLIEAAARYGNDLQGACYFHIPEPPTPGFPGSEAFCAGYNVRRVMSTAFMQVTRRMRSCLARRVGQISVVVFALLMVGARMVCGVHWLSDIVGGLLLSASLVLVYRAAAFGLPARRRV